MKSRPQPNFWKNVDFPLAVAHRGGDRAGIEKENSMAAFRAAYALGYRWFETDLVPTKDGKLLAIHGRGFQLHPNKDLPRRLKLQSMTYSELMSKVTIGGEQPILLEELLEAFPDVKLFLDPKTAKATRCLVKLLKYHQEDLDRICVGSFFIKRTLQVRYQVKRSTKVEICTSILGPASAWPIYIAASFKFLRPFARQYIRKTRSHSLHVPYSWVLGSSGKNIVDYVHELGLKMVVYTPNREADIKASLANEVDVVMSDRAELLKKLVEHSQKGSLA